MSIKQNPKIYQILDDNQIVLPFDIKNDLIYCQRALIDHINVHEMVLQVFERQPDADPSQKRRALEEIENEIYEINADQNYLFLQAHHLLNSFKMRLEEDGYVVELKELHSHIGSVIMQGVCEEDSKVRPINVTVRASEDKLITRYFEEILYEIVDSDEEPQPLPTNPTQPVPVSNNNVSMSKSKRKQPLIEKKLPLTVGKLWDAATLPKAEKPKSLLKPLPQRIEKSNGNGTVGGKNFIDASQFLQIGLKYEKKPFSLNSKSDNAARNSKGGIEPPVETVVSKNAMLRLNLRQALENSSKVRTTSPAPTNNNNNSSGKNGSNEVKNSNSRKSCSPPNTATSQLNKKHETKSKSKRSAAVAFLHPKPIETSVNSSGESERTLTYEDSKGNVLIASKNEFLREFDLHKLEDVMRDMAMRRSKRMRRCVYNDRADFHYGRIDNGQSLYAAAEVQQGKRRKAFLLSPQLKCKTQQPKRPNFDVAGNDEDDVNICKNMEKLDIKVKEKCGEPVEATEEATEEPLGCNECLNEGGALVHCATCEGYYHESCHLQETGEHEVDELIKQIKTILKGNQCPACKRDQERKYKK